MISSYKTVFLTFIYTFCIINFSFSQSNDSINLLFLKSVYDNNLEQTVNFIKHSAEINVRAEDGAAALHYAVVNGNSEMITVLVKHAADLEIRDNNGFTPLALSCALGNDSIAYLLVTMGADLNTTNVRKETPLHLAVLSSNLYLVELLLLFKADPNASDYEGFTPLHLAAFNGSVDMAEILIKSGAHIQSVSNDGDKPIFMALQSGNSDITDYMLRVDTIIFHRNKQNQTILDIAFLEGSEANIQLILKAIDQFFPEKTSLTDSVNSTLLWTKSLADNNRHAIQLLKDYNISRPWHPVFISTAFRTGLSWGINDLFWLYGFDFNEINYRMHTSLGFGTRYWGNRYYFNHTDDTIRLLKEYRSFLWIDLKKDFLIFTPSDNRFHIEILAGIKSNFVWAKYSGLKEREKIHADLVPEIGVKYVKKSICWELTYQYWKYGGINNKPHLVSLYFIVILSQFKH
jgi:ankyrin repeat protein